MPDVTPEQSQQEDAVSAQKGNAELLGDLSVPAFEGNPDAEGVFDVVDLAGEEEDVEDPARGADDGKDGQRGEPEPEEDEDLLAEQVDGQCALHHETLNHVHVPHLEITDGFSGKPVRLRPIILVYEAPNDLKPIDVVVCAKKQIQQEQLADGVHDVHDFDQEVGAGEVTSAAGTGAVVVAGAVEEVTHAAAEHLARALSDRQVLVEVVHEVLNGLLAHLGVRGAVPGDGSVDERRDVHPRASAQEVPDDAEGETRGETRDVANNGVRKLPRIQDRAGSRKLWSRDTHLCFFQDVKMS